MSILLTQYFEPVLVLFLEYSTHKVQSLRFYSRILKVFYVMKENFKQFFQCYYCTRYLHSGCLFMGTVVQEMRMRCTVYLSLRPSSHEIQASPNNTAKFCQPTGDPVNRVPLQNHVFFNPFQTRPFLFPVTGVIIILVENF